MDTYPSNFGIIYVEAFRSGNEAKIEACETYIASDRTSDDYLAWVESIRVINDDHLHPPLFGDNHEQMKRFITGIYSLSITTMPFTAIACHCDALTIMAGECRCGDEDEMPELEPETEEDRHNRGALPERFKLPYTTNPAIYVPNRSDTENV